VCVPVGAADLESIVGAAVGVPVGASEESPGVGAADDGEVVGAATGPVAPKITKRLGRQTTRDR